MAPGAVQGEHRKRLRAFAERLRSSEAENLRQHLSVSTQLQFGAEAGLQRDQTKFLESLRLGSRELLVGELAIGLSAPQREATPKKGAGQSCVSLLQSGSALPEQPLESSGVQQFGLELESVATGLGADAGWRRQRLAELRDVH